MEIPNRLNIEIKTNGTAPTAQVIHVDSGEEIPCTEIQVGMTADGGYTVAQITCVACGFHYLGTAEVVCGCAPTCPACKEKMVRAMHQNEEGDWYVCWLCGCEPSPERIAEIEAQAAEWEKEQ